MIQAFKMAMKSISGSKMRSFLTMLGIIIGVIALVVLVSLVNGATSSVTDAVESLGNDLLTVTISDDYGNPVKLETLQEWSEEEGIGDVAPLETSSATIKYDSDSDTAVLYGTTASYLDVGGLELTLGRFLKTTDVDNNNYVCVVSESVAEDLVGYLDCLGEEISLDGMKFTIVGVLAEDEDSLTSLLTSGTMSVYIPYTTLLRISDSISSDITTFYVSAAEDSDTDTAETVMNTLLLERFEDDSDAFEITTTDVLEDAMSNITSVLTILLGGIAAISLLVGGIGIMNIMLVSVTERTREIGIRKSIGATRGNILRQFLLEAVVLCMLGCLIGLFISWVILKLASVVVSSLSLSFEMNGTVCLVAVVFCFLIGVIFGLYPANKAAKMKPIDALHYGG